MMQRKILIAAAILAGAIVGLILLAFLYLNFADLGRYRGTVESLLSDSLGREVKIAGDFEVDFGFDPEIKAGGITLANPEWSTEPSMVSFDSLELEINLWSLLFGPIRIHRLAISGATVVFEEAADGRVNWVFDTAPPGPCETSKPIRISVGTVDLKDAHISYRGPALDRPLQLGLSSLRIKSDAADMLDFDLAGTLNETDLALAGRIGTLEGLLAAEETSADLDGHLGGVSLTCRGRVGRLATFAGAELEIGIDGRAMSEVTDLLGLPDLGGGPFHIAARASPSKEGSAIDLTGTLGEVTVEATGTTDALLAPELLDAEVRASGPSLAAVAAVAGIQGAADQPWSISGHLRWQGFPISFEGVELNVGDNTVSLNGTLGAPPMMAGTDFRFKADGSDISAIALLAGVDLPAESFQVTGHLTRLEGALGIDRCEATVGPTEIRVHGRLGDPPAFAGTDLRVEAKGPDLSAFSGLAGIALPQLPFEAEGRLMPDGDSIRLDGVSARLGPNTARLDGTVMAVAGFEGTTLQLDAAGPDLSWLEPVTGLEDLPSRPYRLVGGVRVESGGLRLDAVNGRVGEVTARLDGRISLSPGFAGTDLRLAAEGPDASIPASMAGISGTPAEPFRIEGGLKRSDAGFDLDDLQAQIGAARATVSGRIVPVESFTGTTIRFDLQGPDIATFGPIVGQQDLPSLPFSARGSLAIESEGYRLDGITASLGEARAEITGFMSASENLRDTDIDFAIEGPSLAGVGSAISASGLAKLPVLPDEPFSLAGGFAVKDAGFVLRDLHLTLAEATATVTGTLGRLPNLVGTDLTIAGDGPSMPLVTALTGVSVPEAPFRINGRLERRERGLRFHNLRLQLGDYRLQADGILGEPPLRIGTDLGLQASGPSLLLVSQLARIADLPDQPFSLNGRFEGTPRRFKTDGFRATLGSSDVRGNFRIDLADRPRLNGSLESQRVDIRELLVPNPEDQPAESTTSKRGADDGRIISDKPFDLATLGRMDCTLRWSVAELFMPTSTFRDLRVAATLENGSLGIDPVTATGAHGGSLNGSLTLRPTSRGHSFGARVNLADGRFDMSAIDDEPEQWPSINIDLTLTGLGNSPREVASTANGRLVLVVGEGVMDNNVVEALAADVVVRLLETLNPFRKQAPSTMLRCAVIIADVTDGAVVFDPMAIQTDKVTILGDGKVDLSTEKIDFDWVTKPRQGIGVSASLITNPYIKVGGTLSKPSVAMKPLEATASTGLAVVTGGLSLLAKGLLDRVTAEQDVCRQAINQAEKKLKRTAGNHQ